MHTYMHNTAFRCRCHSPDAAMLLWTPCTLIRQMSDKNAEEKVEEDVCFVGNCMRNTQDSMASLNWACRHVGGMLSVNKQRAKLKKSDVHSEFFNCCTPQRFANVRRPKYVYDVTLLQRSGPVPPTWRRCTLIECVLTKI